MDVELRIGGISVVRCGQAATVSLGVNSVTNNNLSKTNYGITYIGDGAAVTPKGTSCNLDFDQADQVNFGMDNIALGPF